MAVSLFCPAGRGWPEGRDAGAPGARQKTHVRAHLAFQLRDVERQLAAPEIAAVPVEGALLGDETRR